MNLNSDEKEVINRCRKRLKYWHITKYILLIFLITCFIIHIRFTPYLTTNKVWISYLSIIGSFIGTLIGLVLYNWNGPHKDRLLVKLVDLNK